jgi:hypothetical protein
MRSRSSGKGNEPGHAISQTCGRVMLALDDIVLVRVAEEITHAQPPEVVITFLTSQEAHVRNSPKQLTTPKPARLAGPMIPSERAHQGRKIDRVYVHNWLLSSLAEQPATRHEPACGGISSLPVAIFSDAGDAHRSLKRALTSDDDLVLVHSPPPSQCQNRRKTLPLSPGCDSSGFCSVGSASSGDGSSITRSWS